MGREKGKSSAPRRKKAPTSSIDGQKVPAEPAEDRTVLERSHDRAALPVNQDLTPIPPEYNVVAPPPVERREPPRSFTITLRAPMQLVDDVDYWVNNRSYKSRSEFILASMRYYLDYLEYRESYNVRTFQRGQTGDVPSERFDRLRYLRGNP